MKKEKVMKILTDYDKLKNQIITITEELNKLDSVQYTRIYDIESLDVEYHENEKENYLELVSEEYYTGCNNYDHDYCEFPVRFLWENFKDEVLNKKEKQEKIKKQEKEKEEEKKRIAKEQREKKELLNLIGKIQKQISIDDDFTSALNELLKNKIKKS